MTDVFNKPHRIRMGFFFFPKGGGGREGSQKSDDSLRLSDRSIHIAVAIVGVIELP